MPVSTRIVAVTASAICEGDRALPDQVVRASCCSTVNPPPRPACGSGRRRDGSSCASCAPFDVAVQARGLGGLGPIKLGGLLAGGVVLLWTRAVESGLHVGDVTGLVEDCRRVRIVEDALVQLARRLLLEGRCREEAAGRRQGLQVTESMTEGRGCTLSACTPARAVASIQMQDSSADGLRSARPSR